MKTAPTLILLAGIAMLLTAVFLFRVDSSAVSQPVCDQDAEGVSSCVQLMHKKNLIGTHETFVAEFTPTNSGKYEGVDRYLAIEIKEECALNYTDITWDLDALTISTASSSQLCVIDRDRVHW